MKKLTKIVSLILALVLVIGASAMPAFAASEKCPECGVSNDYKTTTKSGVPAYMYWAHGCSKGPAIFLIESMRSGALKDVEKGVSTIAYYMDANGDLYTDMPAYGGTLVGKNGSAEKDAAMYGKTSQKTLWELYQKQTNSIYDYAVADTKSYGFSDVPADAPYADAVNALANSGVLIDTGSSRFRPDDDITWKEMYWLLERLLGVDGKYLPAGTSNLSIEEVVAAVMGWNDMQVMVHPANQTPVTRAEAVSIVATLYSLRADHNNIGAKYAIANGGGQWANSALAALAEEAVANGAKEWKLSDIPDGNLLPGLGAFNGVNGAMDVVNTNSILRAYTLGLVNGTDSKGTLNPNGNLTRAEFCQLLYNAGIFGFIKPAAGLTSHNQDNARVGALIGYMKRTYADGTPVSTPDPEPTPTPGSTAQPSREPTPGSTSEPDPEPTPGPTSEPDPEPTPGPTAGSDPEPTPEPTPEPSPGPAPDASEPPIGTETPTGTDAPVGTETPAVSEAPAATEAPAGPETLGATETPGDPGLPVAAIVAIIAAVAVVVVVVLVVFLKKKRDPEG